jgi:type III pantothenate kinase
MNCLQLDFGNSSAKWRLLAGDQVRARGRYLPGDVVSEQGLLACAEQLDAVWVSSVASPEREGELSALVERRWGVQPWYARTQARTGELVNSYTDPARMGVDRWLVMVAGWQRLRSRFVVVDVGSATTIDVVTDAGVHEGGYILPGPELMERALLLDTDRVRFEEQVAYNLAPGCSTAEAVRHGIALAQAGALHQALAQQPRGVPVLICGGAGEQLRALAGIDAEVVPDLVFEGLAVLAAEHGVRL